LPELAGRVAVVTGGSSGIGAAISDRLEAAGAVHRVSRRGPVAIDVTDRAAVQRFLGGLERLDCALFVLALLRRAWVPELTILPAALQAMGNTSPANPSPPGP
jgi:NAD(P)-dependent dehydrogenase (short-subunit alcohol dehydrogenase family)